MGNKNSQFATKLDEPWPSVAHAYEITEDHGDSFQDRKSLRSFLQPSSATLMEYLEAENGHRCYAEPTFGEPPHPPPPYNLAGERGMNNHSKPQVNGYKNSLSTETYGRLSATKHVGFQNKRGNKWFSDWFSRDGKLSDNRELLPTQNSVTSDGTLRTSGLGDTNPHVTEDSTDSDSDAGAVTAENTVVSPPTKLPTARHSRPSSKRPGSSSSSSSTDDEGTSGRFSMIRSVMRRGCLKHKGVELKADTEHSPGSSDNNSPNCLGTSTCSTGHRPKSKNRMKSVTPGDMTKDDHVDSTAPVLSNTSSREQGDVTRDHSVCTNDNQRPSLKMDLDDNKYPRPIPQLGMRIQPNGSMVYVAFLRDEAYGMTTDERAVDLRKRVARYLIGLQRQYHCVVQILPDSFFFRGAYVYVLEISGQSQADVIRCKNALPSCIEKRLITSHAHWDRDEASSRYR